MLTVVRFSAFAQQKYTSVVMHGLLEETVPGSARDSISVRKLNAFDECMQGQLSYGVGNARKLMQQTMATATSNLQKSDVIGSLKSASDILRASPTKDRVIVMVSDMLENSSISSFYANSGVRQLDPAAELAKVQKSEMLGDFGGARVYVMGAGTIPEDGKNAKGIYRDPKTMQSLQKFWAGYIEKSGGILVEFGQPELLSPIR